MFFTIAAGRKGKQEQVKKLDEIQTQRQKMPSGLMHLYFS